ncbi:peroxiredoxin [Halothiobacillus sp. DCM-1]|uniref:peroxiredoxin n=1 Tax=Halothiobacillus sp. DCM-1 TaxID=3112558 RepID=UPI00324B0062
MTEYGVTLGQAIPPFRGATAGGLFIDADTYAGRWWVLYFYPRDNTPGCTTEARDFERLLPEFTACGAAVVGVSTDSLASHEAFCRKQGLSFPLIADTDQSVSRAFDVIRMKQMYGKAFEGIERSTFLIDPAGMIRHIWRKVKVPGHAEAVLAELAARMD